MTMTRRRRITRSVFGAVVGLVVGAIVSVNVVIFAGTDEGYEASFTEVFDENLVVGVVALLVLAAGPIIGVIVALRERGAD